MTKLKNTHVPDKIYAFNVQTTHVLYALIHLPDKNDTASIEVFDDIGIETNNSNTSVQIKTATSKNNPVSNRAKDLWKTFYNWLLAVHEKEIMLENTHFVLFLDSKKTSEFIQLLNDANDIANASQTYLTIKNEFYGDGKEIPESLMEYIPTCFSDNNKNVMIEIIRRFKFHNISENYYEWSFNEFNNKENVPDELAEDIFKHMLGWIDKLVLINQGKPIIISKNQYIKEYSAIFRQLNRSLMLHELAYNPSDEIIEHEKTSLRKYIRQLEVIECDSDLILQAINHYLKSSYHRTQWALNGMVTYNSYDNYENTLKEKWTIYKYRADSVDPIKKGQEVYSDCILLDIECNGMKVPSFFTPGSFHILAEKMEIGWHPDYKTIVGE